MTGSGTAGVTGPVASTERATAGGAAGAGDEPRPAATGEAGAAPHDVPGTTPAAPHDEHGTAPGAEGGVGPHHGPGAPPTGETPASAEPGAPPTGEAPAPAEPGAPPSVQPGFDEGADPLRLDPLRLDPIPLPTTRRSERARQRRRRRRDRWRRGATAVPLVAVAAILVVAVARWGGDGGTDRGPDGAPGRAAAQAVPPVLLAHQDASGRASSLTLLVPRAGRGGGSLVLVPPGTMTEVVSLGLEPVGRSLRLGGPSRLKATVENLFGAGIAEVAAVDDAGLAALLEPVGPLTVDVPQRVEEVDENGRVHVLYDAGPTSVAPADAGRFLSAKGGETDLARLARHQPFFEAWLDAVRTRPDAAPAHPAALADAFRALATGTVETRVVPVEAFGSDGEDGELYRVRPDELGRMVAAAFPATPRHGTAARPRVQILNGTGQVGLADAVRDRLGPAFDVRLTGNAATFDHEHTEVVFYDRGEQAVAERVRKALGVGTLVFSRRPLDVVDVTVVVGKDFRTE